MHNTTRHLTGETTDSYFNGTLDSNQFTILFLVQNDSFLMLLYYKSLFEEASIFFFAPGNSENLSVRKLLYNLCPERNCKLGRKFLF